MRDLSGISEELNILNLYLTNKQNIVAFYIFGSYGTKYQNTKSDIDFAALYDGITSLQEELMLEVKLSDIFKRDDIDVVNLNKAHIALQHNVLYTGELLYCSDNLKLSNFKEHVFNIYGDYGITLKFLYDDYIEGMI